jgi:curli biogenesis system outer membrane secretion channel CsgG
MHQTRILSCIVSLMLAAAIWAQTPAAKTPAAAADTAKAKPPLIAVNNLEGRGITSDEAATLSDVLRTELMNTGKFRVMERGEMDQILKEQGFQQSGACSEQSCIIEMGQLLGAEQLVAGSVGKVGKAFSINVRIISIKTGEIVTNVSHNYAGFIEDLLTSETKKVACKLAGIKPPAPPLPPTATLEPKKKKPVALIAVSTGVLVAGGGAAAYYLFGVKGKENKDPQTQAEPTSVEITW